MPQLMSKPKPSCPGSTCEGCESPNCYAAGGSIKGVNKETTHKGVSEAGAKLHPAFSVGGSKWDSENAKDSHRKTLEEMKSQKKPNLYAEGGEVKTLGTTIGYPGSPPVKKARGGEVEDEDEGIRGSLDKNYYVKGVHSSFAGRGNSMMGSAAKGHWSHGDPKRNNEVGKKQHSKVMSEMSEMKKGDRTNLAEGGEVSDSDMDDELHSALGEEYMSAIDKKDKKGLMSCIEAAVTRCMNKE